MATPSDLAKSAKCFCFDLATFKKIVVYLLVSNAGLLAMTPAQLASAAKCYCFDDDTWKKVVAYLLSSGGGGSGGGNKTTVAATDPVGNGTTSGDRWINSVSLQEWFWDGAAWQPLIGP